MSGRSPTTQITAPRGTFAPSLIELNQGELRMAKKAKKASSKTGKKGLDGRHRDQDGQIDRKHGNTQVKSLRKTYGEHFAAGRRGDMMLKTLLEETGSPSLHDYLRKHHR